MLRVNYYCIDSYVGSCALVEMISTLYNYFAIFFVSVTFPWVENASSLSVSWSYMQMELKTTGAGCCGNNDVPDA